jgi:hypothetical protein
VAEHELTVKHRGQEYQVILDGPAMYVDDSFDHAFGTEVRGHWELNWEETEIVSVIDTDGEEIDPDDVPGLVLAIRDASNDIEIEG